MPTFDMHTLNGAISAKMSAEERKYHETEIADMEAEYYDILHELKPVQQAFVQEYVVSNRPINAMRAANPNCNSQRVAANTAKAWLKLPEIQRAVMLSKLITAHRRQVTPAMIINELSKLAFGNFSDLEFDDKGRPCPKPDDKHLWSCVRPGKIRKVAHKTHTETIVEVKISNQTDALRQLGQWLGMWGGDAGDNSQTVQPVVVMGVDMAAVMGKPALPDGTGKGVPLALGTNLTEED